MFLFIILQLISMSDLFAQEVGTVVYPNVKMYGTTIEFTKLNSTMVSNEKLISKVLRDTDFSRSLYCLKFPNNKIPHASKYIDISNVKEYVPYFRYKWFKPKSGKVQIINIQKKLKFNTTNNCLYAGKLPNNELYNYQGAKVPQEQTLDLELLIYNIKDQESYSLGVIPHYVNGCNIMEPDQPAKGNKYTVLPLPGAVNSDICQARFECHKATTNIQFENAVPKSVDPSFQFNGYCIVNREKQKRFYQCGQVSANQCANSYVDAVMQSERRKVINSLPKKNIKRRKKEHGGVYAQ